MFGPWAYHLQLLKISICQKLKCYAKVNIPGEHECFSLMPKTKLSYAEITILSGNVVHEVDKQCNNAAVPTGNIRFQGEPHTSCLIFSKSFSQNKKM